MRALELYAGIGGFAQAAGTTTEIVAAIDHNQHANLVYSANFSHRLIVKNLETIKVELLESLQADLWWMSPPCQPYTIRGAQRDLDDPRSKSFLRLLEAISSLLPPYVALENVPWFKDSSGHALLLKTLSSAGYTWHERQLCPSEFGVPNIRRRYYLIASRRPLLPLREPGSTASSLMGYLLAQAPPHLEISDDLRARFGESLHVVDAQDPNAVAACFTSAYTNSPVYAGSYLRQHGRIRAFSPHEILRLLGFPATFTLPDTLTRRQQYKLVGNSLSLRPVCHLLSAIPLP